MPYLLLHPGRITSFTQLRIDDGDDNGTAIKRQRKVLIQLLRGARGIMCCTPPVGDGFESSSDGAELTGNQSGIEGDIVVSIPDLVETFREFCGCRCDCENSAHRADNLHVPHKPPGVTARVRWKGASVDILVTASCSTLSGTRDQLLFDYLDIDFRVFSHSGDKVKP